MYCKNCGKEIPRQAAFCPHCGAKKTPLMRIPKPPLRRLERRPDGIDGGGWWY